MPRSIDVTVAAVIEDGQRFLMVEERSCGRVVFNQPAGHLEPEESLIDAVVRETREETGYHFEPLHVVGIYLWTTDAGSSFLRVTFTGPARPPAEKPVLDDGIIAAHWFTRNQLLGIESQLRSPMVLRCVDDYRAGIRYPLECLTTLDAAAPRGSARIVRG